MPQQPDAGRIDTRSGSLAVAGTADAVSASAAVAVFGAYGHTGRFVVAELCRRGFAPVLCGRDAAALAQLGAAYPDLPQRVASVDDAASLRHALDGVVAVINCAGPFLDTAAALIAAALPLRVHYLDVSAEQQSVLDVFEQHDRAARDAGIVVMPGMAFFGGLADLLATAAMGDWTQAQVVDIAVALDYWHPTAGTRRTGQRNHYPRRVITQGRLDVMADPPPTREWMFPAPFGEQAMLALPFSETITLSRHLRVQELHSYFNRSALEDIRNPTTPPPQAADAQGRSSQRFVMEAAVHRGGERRCARASGQDIYAITAPLVAEALARIVDGRCTRAGTVAAGEAFDSRDFLAALAPHGLRLE